MLDNLSIGENMAAPLLMNINFLHLFTNETTKPVLKTRAKRRSCQLIEHFLNKFFGQKKNFC